MYFIFTANVKDVLTEPAKYLTNKKEFKKIESNFVHFKNVMLMKK